MSIPSNEQPKHTPDRIVADFESQKVVLNDCGNITKSLIEAFLNDAEIRFQSIQCRLKNSEKLKAKYSDAKKDYRCLADITDLLGLRVVTFFEDEVDPVAKVIQTEFEIDHDRSVDRRETDPNKFGYFALNYVCKYSQARTRQTEYRKFSGIAFEIQITSILRHAWSEIEHPWYDLRDAFPDSIKRRFARMAALLDVAESEFVTLRNLQADFQRAVDIQVGASVKDTRIDAVSIASLLEDPLVSSVDANIAKSLGVSLMGATSAKAHDAWTKSAALAGFPDINGLRESLREHSNRLIKFVLMMKGLWPPESSL